MRLWEICRKIAQRMPGGRYTRALAAAFCLCRRYPQVSFYKRVLRLSVRACFCIRPHYGPLVCDPAVPKGVLYHITGSENIPSIEKNGITNPVTGAVFLAESPNSAVALTRRKDFSHPVLLKIDSGRMCEDGYPFFQNRERPYIWLTERIPPEYLQDPVFPET